MHMVYNRTRRLGRQNGAEREGGTLAVLPVLARNYSQTNCPARRPWVPAMPMELPAQGVQ